MRHTLEELKAMSDNELHSHWGRDLFPFDVPKGCYRCLTMHGRNWLHCHPEITAEVLRLEPTGYFVVNDGANIRAHLEELYALRLFYDHLYPQPSAADTLEQQSPSAVGATPDSSGGSIGATDEHLEQLRENEYDSRANTR